jgi:hypothetical protein
MAGAALRPSGKLVFAVMQWLMIALLVSLSALLLAAAGVARHIWLQHARPRSTEPAEPARHGEETDLESKA